MRSRTSGWLRTWMGSRDPLPRAPHGNVTPCVTGLDDSRDPNSEGSCVAAIIKPGDTRSKDRKSTRLNSSHGYISYAVFCLKKKKKQLTSQYIALRGRETNTARVHRQERTQRAPEDLNVPVLHRHRCRSHRASPVFERARTI